MNLVDSCFFSEKLMFASYFVRYFIFKFKYGFFREGRVGESSGKRVKFDEDFIG